MLLYARNLRLVGRGLRASSHLDPTALRASPLEASLRGPGEQVLELRGVVGQDRHAANANDDHAGVEADAGEVVEVTALHWARRRIGDADG